MFISIPKEFFVPIVFGDNFTLNLETQNMELDTESKRENYKKSNTKVNEKNIINNGKIYVEIDNEYVNSMTQKNDN